MAREIQLTKGYVAIVDDADFERLSAFKWYVALQRGGHVYAGRYAAGRTAYLHREVLGFGPGDPFVDHRNGDTLDCRRENLRPCTPLGNSQNRGLNKGRKFKGVSLFRTRFRAQIKIAGKVTHLGCYATEVEAARAYDAAAKQHHGEFARLNFS